MSLIKFGHPRKKITPCCSEAIRQKDEKGAKCRPETKAAGRVEIIISFRFIYRNEFKNGLKKETLANFDQEGDEVIG